jgi:hypothetical protein
MQKIALFFLALFAMLASVCRVSFHCVQTRAALRVVSRFYEIPVCM